MPTYEVLIEEKNATVTGTMYNNYRGCGINIILLLLLLYFKYTAMARYEIVQCQNIYTYELMQISLSSARKII